MRDGLVLREALVGEGLALRQAQYGGRAGVLAEDRGELVREAVGVLGLRGDDEHGPAQIAAEAGEEEAAGGVGGRHAHRHGRLDGRAQAAKGCLKGRRFAEETNQAGERHSPAFPGAVCVP